MDTGNGDVSGAMDSAVAAVVPAGKRRCVKETAMNGSVCPQIHLMALLIHLNGSIFNARIWQDNACKSIKIQGKTG